MPPIFFNLYQTIVTDLCQKYQVEALYAFGSVLTDRFSEHSDLDFFVIMPTSLDPLEKGENLLALWLALEKLFARRIDLLTDTSVKNSYLQDEILAHKTLLYGTEKEKNICLIF